MLEGMVFILKGFSCYVLLCVDCNDIEIKSILKSIFRVNMYREYIMASTRNKNTPEDYKMEIMRDQNYLKNRTFELSARPESTYLPGNGLMAGRVAAEQLSSNSIDIESKLRGIRATDLVNGVPACNPRIHDLNSLSVADRMELIMPEPLVVEKNQRPGYMG